MTNLEAAVQVLEAEEGPLHFREIARRAIAEGYVEPKGKTPDATMASALYGHVKQMVDKEEPAKVESRGKGRFALVNRKIAGTVESLTTSAATAQLSTRWRTGSSRTSRRSPKPDW